MFEFINQELTELRKAGLYRELRLIDLKSHKIFCSNDYLGLSKHPKVKERAIAAIKEFGFGAGASRLISGNTPLHEELEHKIAKFKKREAALVFPTGYMANLGAITSLVNENDTVIIDRLNHASIIDACRLSRAKLQVYPHKDLATLEKILQRSEKFKKRLIVTDAVFSMDGDISPVKEIVALGKKYNAMTMVDYAHATGVVEIEGEPDIAMGTLSKALGSIGGFIAGSQGLIDYLRNKARSFIYTTALPPAACAASIAALEIIESELQLKKRLWKNIRTLSLWERGDGSRQRVRVAESSIIPIMIGSAERTMNISKKLFDNGFFISGIRPPTVPEGESRLRITITADQSKEDIECLASLLQELIPAAARLT
ncbi:MAG: 8-amino-7-oxononanoate synthase [Candidatus Margulisbacteria bacterium]|nr:8-amino-7-oxononanoate synthase [Candidatus Margulisiibacteriota bacterium]